MLHEPEGQKYYIFSILCVLVEQDRQFVALSFVITSFSTSILLIFSRTPIIALSHCIILLFTHFSFFPLQPFKKLLFSSNCFYSIFVIISLVDNLILFTNYQSYWKYHFLVIAKNWTSFFPVMNDILRFHFSLIEFFKYRLSKRQRVFLVFLTLWIFFVELVIFWGFFFYIRSFLKRHLSVALSLHSSEAISPSLFLQLSPYFCLFLPCVSVFLQPSRSHCRSRRSRESPSALTCPDLRNFAPYPGTCATPPSFRPLRSTRNYLFLSRFLSTYIAREFALFPLASLSPCVRADSAPRWIPPFQLPPHIEHEIYPISRSSFPFKTSQPISLSLLLLFSYHFSLSSYICLSPLFFSFIPAEKMTYIAFAPAAFASFSMRCIFGDALHLRSLVPYLFMHSPLFSPALLNCMSLVWFRGILCFMILPKQIQPKLLDLSRFHSELTSLAIPSIFTDWLNENINFDNWHVTKILLVGLDQISSPRSRRPGT